MEEYFDKSFFFYKVYNSYDKLTGVILDILIHIHKWVKENQTNYKVHGFQKGVNKRSIMSKC